MFREFRNANGGGLETGRGIVSPILSRKDQYEAFSVFRLVSRVVAGILIDTTPIVNNVTQVQYIDLVTFYTKEGGFMLKYCIFVLFLSGLATAWVPNWATAYQLVSNGNIIDVGNYAAPCVVDWDLDGIKDLILGQFSNGYIYFYKNVGTNNAPVFNGSVRLYADGSPISMAYG